MFVIDFTHNSFCAANERIKWQCSLLINEIFICHRDKEIRIALNAFRKRGHAIGKDIDIPNIGIKNGINFHNFGIRNSTDFQDFGMKCNFGCIFSKNWYKVGYTFSKNWCKKGVCF